jgi:hypothetical protein
MCLYSEQSLNEEDWKQKAMKEKSLKKISDPLRNLKRMNVSWESRNKIV